VTQPIVRVRTPENIELEYQLAGIGSRAVAQILDLLILMATYAFLAIAVLYWGLSHLLNAATPYIVGVAVFLYFFLFWGYFILFEYYMSGQTLGKRIIKLRVVHQDGRHTSFLSVLLRNVFRLIDILPSGYLVGLIVMILDPRERRLGDLVAGTIVVQASATQRFIWLDPLSETPEGNGRQDLSRSPDTAQGSVRIVTVKGLQQSLAVATNMPPSWQTFVLSMAKRVRNMSHSQREMLVERTWTRMYDEGLIRVLDPDGAEAAKHLGLTNTGKLKFIVALARSIRQQQRGKRG
jgi:uncharacterized RDD family membrane protein YckC